MLHPANATILICLVCAVCLACGCQDAPPIQHPPIALDTTGVQPRVDYSALAEVLSKAVNSDRYVVEKKLRPLAGRLDEQLRLLAVTGPDATPKLLPNPDDRLAYWLNARAAWAIKLALVANFPEEVGPGDLPHRMFPLDGKMMNLWDLDAQIFDYGWQAIVAAPGISMERAMLPDKPFSPQDVQAGIRERLIEFIDDEKRFLIDVEEQTIYVPPILWFFREDLIDTYQTTCGTTGATLTTALLPYVHDSALRRLQDVIGYKVKPAKSSKILAVLKER
ncbi:MAG: hypothetical protein HZA50_07835 [Planctomycetes bacterium]|nr:hypothetical protein [Planctomycetota bacterium]